MLSAGGRLAGGFFVHEAERYARRPIPAADSLGVERPKRETANSGSLNFSSALPPEMPGHGEEVANVEQVSTSWSLIRHFRRVRHTAGL